MSKPAQPRSETEIDTASGLEQPHESLPREDIFEVLSNQRRRYALHHLKKLDGNTEALSLSELASKVAAWENDVDAAEVSYDERKSVQTSLYQHHLPKLAEKDLIEYDKRAGQIGRSDSIEDIDIFLEPEPNREITWPLLFLGVSSVSLTLSMAVLTEAVFIDALPATIWFFLSSLGIMGLSLLFAYFNRY